MWFLRRVTAILLQHLGMVGAEEEPLQLFDIFNVVFDNADSPIRDTQDSERTGSL